MRRAFGALVTVLAVLAAGSSGGVTFAAPSTQPASDVLDFDTPTQKAFDLHRAHANGEVSPDRLVVVYDRPSSTSDPQRTQVRQVAAAQVLHASRNLRRDVLRVSGANAAVVAQH